MNHTDVTRCASNSTYPKFPLLIRTHQRIVAAPLRGKAFTMRALIVCLYVLSSISPLMADAIVSANWSACGSSGSAYLC